LSSFDFFDKVYVVHLPNEQRRKHMDAQLSSIGRSATYVCADAPPKGFSVPNMRRNPPAEFGAGLSHISAIAQAMADGAKRPLFLEDDIVFKKGADDRLGSALEFFCNVALDLLYLGGHPRKPVMDLAPHVTRVWEFSCAEAYSIRGDLLGPFIRYWCNRITRPDAMFDFILGEFAAKNKAFCVYPVITEQAQFVSHIKGTVDDKRALVERGWQNNLSTK
jgi:GR25 family glycosyltransferase involved in LPS biosynthesis